jgi:hypothetical protein
LLFLGAEELGFSYFYVLNAPSVIFLPMFWIPSRQLARTTQWSVCALLLLLSQVIYGQKDKPAAGSGPDLPEVEQYRKKVLFADPMVNLPQIPYTSSKPETVKPSKATSEFEYSPGIERQLERFKKEKYTEFNGSGFRVQIYDGPNAGASQAQTDFLKRFEDMDVYLTFESPSFKVRAGNFKTQSEASLFLKEIKPYFPNSFVVPDQIQITTKKD